jgi:hypothetical protein
MEHHLSSKPGFACDIGAGSGRDANWACCIAILPFVAINPFLQSPDNHRAEPLCEYVPFYQRAETHIWRGLQAIPGCYVLITVKLADKPVDILYAKYCKFST